MVKNHGVNSSLNAYIQKGNNNDELVINHSKTSMEDKCSAPCLMASLLERGIPVSNVSVGTSS